MISFSPLDSYYVKFIVDDHLIYMTAKEDMIASTSSVTPYVELDEEAMECFFWFLEFVNATFVHICGRRIKGTSAMIVNGHHVILVIFI